MNAITQTSGFALQPSSMEEAMKLANMLANSGMVPKSYERKPEATLVAMMMGAELGLNPIQSLQNIAVINNKPSIYSDALLALVQNHPKFGGHEETMDEKTMTAFCTVWRKGDVKKHTVSFSRADAQQAGLWGKQGPWTQYPKRMLMWRARGYALRDKFADALGGLITVEEARDIPAAEPRIVNEPQSRTALEYYPQERFDENLPKWRAAIAAGKKSPDDIITLVESKAMLTDQQKESIKAPQEQ